MYSFVPGYQACACHARMKFIKIGGDNFGDLVRQQGGHGVADLVILLRARPLKKVIVRERLQPRRLADGQAAALRRFRVNKIMAVLGDV